ncbi:hypothetical protein MMC10_007602 [Thelotrema lepadinum]|nr:hypothetical protein [Thelotrema lepadinum]
MSLDDKQDESAATMNHFVEFDDEILETINQLKVLLASSTRKNSRPSPIFQLAKLCFRLLVDEPLIVDVPDALQDFPLLFTAPTHYSESDSLEVFLSEKILHHLLTTFWQLEYHERIDSMDQYALPGFVRNTEGLATQIYIDMNNELRFEAEHEAFTWRNGGRTYRVQTEDMRAIARGLREHNFTKLRCEVVQATCARPSNINFPSAGARSDLIYKTRRAGKLQYRRDQKIFQWSGLKQGWSMPAKCMQAAAAQDVILARRCGKAIERSYNISANEEINKFKKELGCVDYAIADERLRHHRSEFRRYKARLILHSLLEADHPATSMLVISLGDYPAPSPDTFSAWLAPFRKTTLPMIVRVKHRRNTLGWEDIGSQSWEADSHSESDSESIAESNSKLNSSAVLDLGTDMASTPKLSWELDLESDSDSELDIELDSEVDSISNAELYRESEEINTNLGDSDVVLYRHQVTHLRRLAQSH